MLAKPLKHKNDLGMINKLSQNNEEKYPPVSPATIWDAVKAIIYGHIV